jgi:hypothetical protein
MVVVLFLGIARRLKDRRELSILVSLVSGLVSACLMNRERVKGEYVRVDRSRFDGLVLAWPGLDDWACNCQCPSPFETTKTERMTQNDERR